MARPLLALFGLAAAPLCLAGAAPAGLGEVLVTGERIARPLTQTASSAIVLTAAQVEALGGADRLDQVLALVPNLQPGSGGDGPAMRGNDTTGVLRDLPAFLGGTRPRATLQVDGRAASFNEFVFGVAPLWDVERVEVFRSPQTATQGRNAIAGAIFVETRAPAHEWEGRLRVLSGEASTRQASMAISGPLVADKLAFRISGDLRSSRTSSRIVDVYEGADPNRDDYAQLRMKLLFGPRSPEGSRLLLTYAHLESVMPQIEGVRLPFERRRDPLAGYGVLSTAVDSLTAVLEQPHGDALASTTTVTFGNATIERFALPGLGQTHTRSRDMAAESRLQWQPRARTGITAGASFLQARLDQQINLARVIGSGEFDDRQHSLGLFGEARLALGSLDVAAGLRYQRDDQDRQGELAGPLVSLPVGFDEVFSAWLPRLEVSREFAGGTARVGALVQRAFNPGGVALNFEARRQDVFGAETVWNHELFVRAAPVGRRLEFAGNLFLQQGRDSQRARMLPYAVPGGATAFWSEIVNVPTTRSRGIEAELTWRADARLVLRAALGALDTDIQGRQSQRAPQLSATAAADWRPRRHWQLSMQCRYHGSYFSDDLNTRAFRIDPATVCDAHVRRERGRWAAFGYARNLFDHFHMTAVLAPNLGTAGDPREMGVGIEARF